MVKAAEASARLRESGRKCLRKTLKLARFHEVRKFLTADSYMYGALVSPSGASGGQALPQAAVRKEIRKKKKLRLTRSGRDVGLFKKTEDATHSKNRNQQVTISYMNVQHAVATPDAAYERASRELGNVAGDGSSPHGESETDSLFEDLSTISSLEDHEADKVVLKLVNKFGGRTSKELGIDVDKGDEEVEKWLLAVALINRSISPEISSETFQNILNSGITRLSDTLNIDQEEIANILEKAGYRSYPERTASRLRRLAVHLKTEHNGSISSLNGVSNPSELSRQLGGLLGLSQNNIRLFLREMRGVWPGVSSSFDNRAENAARHLRLVGCKTNSADRRDVEAALTKLSTVHARHYQECPGGMECQMLEDA